MQPIISPWFIYLLGIIDSFKEGLSIVAVFVGLAFIGFLTRYFICKCDDYNEKYVPFWKKLSQKAFPVFVISFLLAIFLPSKSTLIGMFVAKNITHDNVEKALKAGGSFKEEIKKDVFELIEALQDKKEKTEQDGD